MSLTDEELERYQRHILLQQVGGPGQAKLRQARVLVIGAGGLGAPALMYLAAAGVGNLGVIDDDVVDLSNLQRQIIHTTGRIGSAKTDSAAQTIKELNPNVNVNCHKTRLVAGNALEIIGSYDFVVDGSDNFATRYLVNDACYFAKKPLIWAAVGQFEGHVSTFKPYLRDDNGKPLPSYRCLFPEAPPPGLVPTCEEAGILGALTGIIGSLQAIETIKEIVDIGESLAGRLLIYDALDARFQTISLAWDKTNPLNGESPTIKDLSLHSET
jgi:adenylyltransferase/sulfurtransferase